MNELALFAGAGGGILGGKLLGWRTVCAVEIEKYPRERLMQRQDEEHLEPFPVWDDVRTFDGKPWRGIVDVVSGGFPCQDISIAGKGAGIDGERSGLWGEMARIISEVMPQYVFVENSPMLAIRGLGTVLRDFSRMGYVGRYGTLGGFTAGGFVDRKRMWIVATRATGQRFTSPKIQTAIVDKRKSSKRQFERAISATISEETYTTVHGDNVELARWMDRFKAIGNGQDARLAKYAWEILST